MSSHLRIGGLASGMDIDELVEKLMSAERAPLDKLEQQKQIYEWTRDAYRNVNTKLQTFDTYIADNLLLKSFNTKTATSSNSSLVEVTATSSATGTLTIEGVSQLAAAARAVGNQVNATGTTRLGDLFASSGVTVNQNYIEIRAIQKDGTLASKATRIDFTEDMTINDFVKKINNSGAGISVIFENGRLSITAKNTGDVNGDAEIVIDSGYEVFEAFGFTLTDSTTNTGSKNLADNGKNAIFQINGIATERASNTFSISGYNITLKNTFNNLQTIAEKFLAAVKEKENAQKNLDDKSEQYTTAKDNYYGVNATETPSYASSHDDAYIEAFGKTLSLSQLEAFNKLGSSFWKKLSDKEIDFIIENKGNLKAAIAAIDENEATDYSNLKGLSDEKIEILESLSDVDDFSSYVKYQKFDSATIAAIKGLDLNNKDEEELISEIENSDLSDEVKNTLKSYTKDELSKFQSIAHSEELKSKFNTLGDSFLKNLSDDEINEILQGNYDGLTSEQIEALEGLTKEQLEKFRNLADQNIKRNDYLKATSELKAAQARNEIAISTFNTAKADAENAGILIDNNDGSYSIDTDKINSAPTTSPVTITSSTNVDEIVSKIKDFVNTYNNLIKELNSLLKESKYRDYPPLTEAQRKEMKEKEIELWEQKAKSGLLRNDSIIRDGISNIRALVYETYPGVSNTKYNALYTIGITTSNNYNDGGLLEIDENKLRAALEEDPDAVAALFTNALGKKDDTIVVNGNEKKADTRGFLQRLREEISNIKLKIEKKAGRSTMTANQYALGKTLNDIEKRIKDWKEKLETIEERYWKQFTAMEKAVNKANMQASLFMPQYY